jgi:hypothetical protein
MELPKELAELKPRKPPGKPPRPRRTLEETRPIREFFQKRQIPNRRLSARWGVSVQTIGNWWAAGIPESNMEAIKELMNRIATWEEKSGRRFPG